MKRITKKLPVQLQTIRVLSTTTLARVIGGGELGIDVDVDGNDEIQGKTAWRCTRVGNV